MKILISTMLVLGFSSFAMADDDREISINSFQRVEYGNHNNPTAELCGHITGASSPHDRMIVEADPRGNPGRYTTTPGPEGNFCILIRTQTGQAKVTLWVMGEDHPEKKTISADALLKK